MNEVFLNDSSKPLKLKEQGCSDFSLSASLLPNTNTIFLQIAVENNYFQSNFSTEL